MTVGRADVVHVLAPSRAGGLERVVQTLLAGQRRRGTDARAVAVVEPEARPHPFVAGLESSGTPVEVVPVPHRAYLTEFRAVAELFGRLSPRLVHTHGYRADVLSGWIARRNDIPVVSTVHGFTGGGLKNRFYEWLQVRSLSALDAVVAVSQPLAKQLRRRGVGRRRIHVIPNAWRAPGTLPSRSEARRRLGLPDDRFVVGWVGRLSAEKGPDVLLRAAAAVAEDDMVFSILGAGPMADSLRTQADSLDVDGRVCFHGLVPDAWKVYPAFDAFVICSRSEGTPVALFEALEAGVPVIATRVGGIPDVVGSEEAVLVSPEDPVGLARALESIASNRECAAARVRRGRRRLHREFGVEAWLDSYERVYRIASGYGTAGGA